jgi:hypothetical protein
LASWSMKTKSYTEVLWPKGLTSHFHFRNVYVKILVMADIFFFIIFWIYDSTTNKIELSFFINQ